MGSPASPSVLETLARIDFGLAARARHPEIQQLLNETVLHGGKRFRPLLTLLFGELLGVSSERLIPFARAVELTHAASLAHDDVIDESGMRRDRPTLRARSSNAKAVLAGDLLLAHVIEEISALGEPRLTHDLSLAVQALTEAEWLQLEARGSLDVSEAHLEKIARMKTGSLLAWSCRCPAHLAGLPLSLVEEAGRFGEEVGLAFQMLDDVLDFEVTAGKPFAQDLREGLVNFAARNLLAHDPEMKPRLIGILGNGEVALSPSEGPWTSEQLEHARQRVREKAGLVVHGAIQRLDRIAVEFEKLTGRPPAPHALETLRAALDQLLSRRS